MRMKPDMINQLLHPMFDEAELKKAVKLAKGLAASPGAACGQIYFHASRCGGSCCRGARKVILTRLETSPEDLAGMIAAREHPDCQRRHDLPCGGSCQRHG